MSQITLTLRIVLPIVILLLIGGMFVTGYRVYSASQNVEIMPEKNKDLFPDEAIRLHFSKPMLDNDYRENIRITPAINTYVSWENSGSTLVFTPQNLWTPETTYTITLPEGKTTSLATIEATQIPFQTIPYPKVISSSPENEAHNVIVGIEDPIVIEFDKGVEGFWIDFEFSPEKEIIYQTNDDHSRFEILPETELESGKRYEFIITAYPENHTEPSYRKVLKTISFQTLPPPPSNWSKDNSERILQAKRFTQPQITEGKYIDVNIEAQIMSLFENGELLDSYLISSGLAGMDTPKGTFQIYNQHPRPWSKQYELFMPFWMAITPDGKYGIHELPEWPGGHKEGAHHLGIPVSHGCVRLGVGSAERVYNWAEIGTPVIIY